MEATCFKVSWRVVKVRITIKVKISFRIEVSIIQPRHANFTSGDYCEILLVLYLSFDPFFERSVCYWLVWFPTHFSQDISGILKTIGRENGMKKLKTSNNSTSHSQSDPNLHLVNLALIIEPSNKRLDVSLGYLLRTWIYFINGYQIWKNEWTLSSTNT